MGHTLYDGTIVVAQGILGTLSHILHQGEQHSNASTLLDARLYEDMYPLSDQIRIATQFTENVVARLTGRESVTYEGKPTTFAECYERIETVLKTLNEADKDVVNQNAEVSKTETFGSQLTVQMTAAEYAHTAGLPNVYFHLSTAYGILRKEGVPLGKKDYYQGFVPFMMGAKQ
ncbi:hypothetical protein FE257_008208 [Aspergillus nanangensis]|uniref:DUF1993 domain-containing protein n=1 Tax=Aspergillus nanangensis TaxID=2582783 RepID=A0AAD4GST7_ASPNN|nr:hypothetical protein FE257_008208 [Aspergillus nanangensis]